MEESKGHRKHDRQFKAEAVKLVTEGNRPVAEVARGLGIHANSRGFTPEPAAYLEEEV